MSWSCSYARYCRAMAVSHLHLHHAVPRFRCSPQCARPSRPKLAYNGAVPVWMWSLCDATRVPKKGEDKGKRRHSTRRCNPSATDPLQGGVIRRALILYEWSGLSSRLGSTAKLPALKTQRRATNGLQHRIASTNRHPKNKNKNKNKNKPRH